MKAGQQGPNDRAGLLDIDQVRDTWVGGLNEPIW